MLQEVSSNAMYTYTGENNAMITSSKLHIKEESTPHRVLIIDDNRGDLFLLESILNSREYDTHTLNDPTRAAEVARSVLPDVILLDVAMPEIDGFTLCVQLKADPDLQDIPVVFLTAMSDVKAKIAGFDAGGNDFLVKPVDPAELLARVATQVKLYHTQMELAARNYQLKQKIRDIEKAHADLLESESRNEAILNNAAVGIAVLDNHGNYEMVNDLCAELFGYSPDELARMCCLDVVHPDFSDDIIANMGRLCDGLQNQVYSSLRFIRKDGTKFWGGHWLSTRRDQEGICTGFVCVITDLTEQKRAENKLRLAHTVFETSSEAILVTDAENRIVMVNPAFTTISGFSREQALGKNPGILQSGRHDREFYRQMWADLAGEDRWQGEIWNRRANGEIYPQWLSIAVIHHHYNKSVANYVAVFSDISERKKAEEILRHQALHDPLTSLPNRVMFHECFHAALSRARRQDAIVALLYIDLDGFKTINDELGHLAGDRALQVVAECLRDTLRQEDMVARLGGDEFAIILSDIEDPQQIIRAADRLLASIADVNCSDNGHALSLSIGIANYPEHGNDAQTLLRLADDAMYTAKRLGKGRYHISD